MDLKKFNQKAKSQKKINKKFLKKLEKGNSRVVDEMFHTAHEEVFAKTNCLDCANCCKTMTPTFTQKDIRTAARELGMKPKEFTEKYLYVDDEDDWVLEDTPCPLLDKNNKCRIYEERPRSCREFPHTNKKKMVNLIDTIYDNSLSCPAVLEIVNKMKAARPS